MDTCEVCGARVGELRRSRCWGCYSRWVSARPVGMGASCRLCGERRRDCLRSIELFGAWSPVCHGCAGLVTRLDPMPPSLAEVRDALRRERRRVERRTDDDLPSLAGERRTGERRRSARLGASTGASAVPRDSFCIDDETSPIVDDEMVLEIAELASELQSLAEDLGEVADLTRIHDFSR
jgi:hypothetical protein